jgi:hypothetical protein
MLLAQLYDRHAEECARAAEQADDPRRRALMIKLAAEWRRDAQALRQSEQPIAAGVRPAVRKR